MAFKKATRIKVKKAASGILPAETDTISQYLKSIVMDLKSKTITIADQDDITTMFSYFDNLDTTFAGQTELANLKVKGDSLFGTDTAATSEFHNIVDMTQAVSVFLGANAECESPDEDQKIANKKYVDAHLADKADNFQVDGTTVSFDSSTDPKTLKANIPSNRRYKGLVASTSDLPTTGNTDGDCYFVGTSGATTYDEYCWIDALTTTDKWIRIGSTSPGSGTFVDTTSDQSIGGIKTFTHPNGIKFQTTGGVPYMTLSESGFQVYNGSYTANFFFPTGDSGSLMTDNNCYDKNDIDGMFEQIAWNSETLSAGTNCSWVGTCWKRYDGLCKIDGVIQVNGAVSAGTELLRNVPPAADDTTFTFTTVGHTSSTNVLKTMNIPADATNKLACSTAVASGQWYEIHIMYKYGDYKE